MTTPLARRLAVATSVLALVAAGCGGGGDDDQSQPSAGDPAAVVAGYYAAAKDTAAKCEALSADSIKRFGGSVDSCAKRIVPATGEVPAIKTGKVVIEEGKACVGYVSPSGGQGVAITVQEAGEWKIDALDSASEPSSDLARECASKEAIALEVRKECLMGGGSEEQCREKAAEAAGTPSESAHQVRAEGEEFRRELVEECVRDGGKDASCEKQVEGMGEEAILKACTEKTGKPEDECRRELGFSLDEGGSAEEGATP